MLGSLNRLVSDWGFEVTPPLTKTRPWPPGSNQPPGLMILDYHLDHGRTGLDLLRQLHQAGHQCPTILISADHAAEVRQAAKAAGCEFLHKPIRPLALRSLLNRLT
jgi:CheY-like chemotaxis protein